MRMMLDLAAAWSRSVAAGTVKHVFTDRVGRQVEGGVRLGAAGPEAYAIETRTGLSLCDGHQLSRLSNGMDVLFNAVAGLKPHTRPSAPGRQPDLPSGTSACAFRCQNPDDPASLISREPLLQTSLPHHQWRVFPNVAPWEPRGLVVWVPCRSSKGVVTLPHLPQVLTYEVVEDFLFIAASATGMATFFNSLHGGASADHLHFQSAYCDRLLAVEHAPRIACGAYTAVSSYPASCLFFSRETPAGVLWPCVDKIQQSGYPVNLIGLSSGIFLFVRNPENEVLAEFPGRAFGAVNFAGLFISSDEDELARVTGDLLAKAYSKMTLPLEELMPVLEGS